MRYILYASSAIVPFNPEQLDELLRISRRNNASVGVTGMLLYYDGNFIQYIEGGSEALDGLYDRIAADPRHRGLLVLDSGEISDRILPEWSMGFEDVSPQDDEAIGAFALTAEALDGALDPALPKTVIAMMRTFHRTMNLRNG
ncbi:MAG: BLUF domain-containing protein [Alphaproteobacteria bacterium]|nr:BLUF domain-containing protein [Alphaproteobacteria bacterium]